MRGNRTHVDVGVESPHERLIPRIFDNTGPTQMINDICQILDPVFRFSGPELCVEIRFGECRNDSWYMRDSGDVEDDYNLKGTLVICFKTERIGQSLYVPLDFHLVRHSPRV